MRGARRTVGPHRRDPSGQLICYYQRDDDATLHAAIAVSRVGDDRAGLSVAELPGGPAATVIHRGAMDEVLPAWQSMAHARVFDVGHSAAVTVAAPALAPEVPAPLAPEASAEPAAADEVEFPWLLPDLALFGPQPATSARLSAMGMAA